MLNSSNKSNPFKQTPYYDQGMKIQQILNALEIPFDEAADNFSISQGTFDKILVGAAKDVTTYKRILSKLMPLYEEHQKKLAFENAVHLFKEANYKFDLPAPILQLRIYLNMTQKEFAQMLNVDVHTVKNWEVGRTKPNANAELLMILLLKGIAKPNDLLFAHDTFDQIAYG
ncbi:MAG: helix-turn-helix domain-containing protein [Streptococcaceae bacterium]|jgi:DNA-binding transcriptional regulator YiaG|nr:helix-turn-helix domain-containing protein [Streptococcaceae bacterium]